MKEKPIIFSGSMVRAILDGRKTQTRRVMKYDHFLPKRMQNAYGFETFILANPMRFTPPYLYESSPYGCPGDRIWVKETWQTHCDMDSTKPSDLPVGTPIQYPATYDGWVSKKRSPIFMPRWASRITLEITKVRAECVQDISWEDAVAEGFRVDGSEIGVLDKFQRAWNQINGKKHPWSSNPWVWAYTFKVIDK